ncbi:hypothetical protein Taro_053040 [Colocasia esculenta]|uniref:Xrn1 helical domain-containing protein n=1 Tax=Colocasia esculenta TaxID=4460 RepID=A0A843XLV2_COLES|nr:hypothetical protein [Colocasia esculenta]
MLLADFDVDVDGKRFLWQGIVKLPFIEETILLTETRKLETQLNAEEQRRNSIKLEKIFVSRSHDLGKDIWSLYHSHDTETGKQGIGIAIDCNRSGGMNGFLCLAGDKAEGCHFSSPVNGMDDIVDDHVVSAFYQNPANHDHVPRLPENVTIPLDEVITESDIVERKLWHEHEFSSPVPPSRG